MNQIETFELIHQRIVNIQTQKTKPIRIAINGIEGTGKTVFTEKLTAYLNAHMMKAIHVSIDGFHFNKARRYQQGRNSAKGYYEDSYDEKAFVDHVLLASQAERPKLTMATHDLETDEYLDVEFKYIDRETVIITDGAYLFKSIYRDHWDLKIYLKTSFEIAMERGIQRDKQALGGVDQAKEKFIQRYHNASRIYQNEHQPELHADIVFDISDFDNLELLKHSAS